MGQINFDDLPDKPKIDFSALPDAPESTPEEPKVEDNRSVFKRGWDTISSPLVNIMEPKTPEMAEGMKLFNKQHPWIGKGMDVLGGVVSGVSSPLSLATMGAGGLELGAAKLGMNTVANAAKWGGRALGAGDVASGVEDIEGGHPIAGLTQIAMGGATAIPRSHGSVNEAPPIERSNLFRRGDNKAIQNRLGNITKEVSAFGDQTSQKIDLSGPKDPNAPIQIGEAGGVLPKRNQVTGKMESTKPSSGNLPGPPISDDAIRRMQIKFNEATKRFNTIDEVIKNIEGRTDIDNIKKQKLINKVHENQISSTGEVPNNPSILGQANNFSKTMLASYDVSAPGRQGLALWNTKAFWTSMDDMFKSWGSERAYKELKDGISERELFKTQFDSKGKVVKSFAEQSGLSLPDILGGREERFAKSFAEMFPGVRPSERAYTGFLNKLRADHFETLIGQAEAMGLDPKHNMKLSKDIAEFVNTATGRGDLGRFEKHADLLNAAFFSPRFMASRMQMLDPRYYLSEQDPFVRRQKLKSAMALAGASVTMNTLYSLAGGQTSLDPTSTDFMKSVFGKTRMDPNAGIQQPIVLTARLMADLARRGPKILDSAFSGDWNGAKQYAFKDRTAQDTMLNYVENKASPVASFLAAYARGTDFDQKPFELKRALINRVTPIMTQDLLAIIQENDPKLLGLVPFAVAGQGMSTYSR